MFEKTLHDLFKYLTRHVIIRYGISGGLAGVTDLSLLYLFNGVFDLHYLPSAILAFIGAFFVSFLMHKFWTFESHEEETSKQMAMYLGTSLFGLILNTLLMYLFVDYLFTGLFLAHEDSRVLFSQVVVALLGASITFFISRNFVFKYKPK